MAMASSDGRSHSSAMGIAAFSLSHDEVIAASRVYFVRRGGELTGSHSVITIPATPFSVPAFAEPSVYFGLILATPQLLDSGRNGPSLPHQVCCVGSKAGLQNFVDWFLLHAHSFEVREASTEMLWLFGPNLSSLPSVTLRNFDCRYGIR